MKKIAIPLKEENCIIKELRDKEIEQIEAGGCFGCFTFKRCVSLWAYKPIRPNCKKDGTMC